MNYLTIKEVAELKECSVRYIRTLCSQGKIKTEIQPHPQNKKPCYMIPVTALPEELQVRYYSRLTKYTGIPEKTAVSIEELSADERIELNFWCGLLKEWQARRSKYGSKCEFDRNFIGECRLKYDNIKISTDILYRKWSAYRNNDYYGILGRHTSWNRGKSSIPEPVWDNFLWNWLDEKKPTVSLCYRLAIEWTKEFYPELLENIPSLMTFRRRIEKDISAED